MVSVFQGWKTSSISLKFRLMSKNNFARNLANLNNSHAKLQANQAELTRNNASEKNWPFSFLCVLEIISKLSIFIESFKSGAYNTKDWLRMCLQWVNCPVQPGSNRSFFKSVSQKFHIICMPFLTTKLCLNRFLTQECYPTAPPPILRERLAYYVPTLGQSF